MTDTQTFGDRVFQFFRSIKFDVQMPMEVEVMNPYREARVRGYVRAFLSKFYFDNRERVLVFGINPGRFGSGITGITFTDPVALEMFCDIPNDLPKKRELSSVFIYEFAKHWGGAQKLYQDFYFTAVSPLGFTKNGKNFNFYDDPRFLADIKPFLINSIKAHLAFGVSRKAAIVLGTGKIRKVFEQLNQKNAFFQTVYSVEHPRFIMQYRRKYVQSYLEAYQRTFAEALG